MDVIAQGHSRDQVFSIDDKTGALVDISADLTNISLATSKGVVDVTTFGDNYRDYLAGVADATLSIEGIYDPAAAHAGTILAGMSHGTATQSLSWVWGPQGTATGKPKMSGESFITAFSGGAGLDAAVTFQASLQNTGTITFTQY